MTWAIVATILSLGAMAQAEFWAREWYDKRCRRAAAEKRLARIRAMQERRERFEAMLEDAKLRDDARKRQKTALAVGDMAAVRAEAGIVGGYPLPDGRYVNTQGALSAMQSAAEQLTDVGTCAYSADYESPGAYVARREPAPAGLREGVTADGRTRFTLAPDPFADALTSPYERVR